MELKELEQRIAVFYEGNSSKAEERALYDYFLKAENLPERFETDRRLFLELHKNGANIEVPAHLEQQIDSLIDRLAEDEKNQSSRTTMPSSPVRRMLSWQQIAAIAACILILVSGGIYLIPPHEDEPNRANTETSERKVDTFTNPEDAYQATEKALLLASTKLNKAFEQVESVQATIDKKKRR